MAHGDARAILTEIRERAARALPCARCGSEGPPLIRQPRPLSFEWWEDPSCYMGCADCSAFFAPLPSIHPGVWQTEVPDDRVRDPDGVLFDPRELD